MVVIQYQNNSSLNQLNRDGNLYDLYANANCKLNPGDMSEISTGVSVLVPNDIEVKFYEVLHHLLGVYVINDSFVSDGNWRKLDITLKNKHQTESVKIKEGQKIAQIRFGKLKNPTLERV
jgi:dUTPase